MKVSTAPGRMFVDLDPSAFLADPELIRALATRATTVPCDADSTLFKQDDSPVGVYIVHQGQASLSMKSPEGRSDPLRTGAARFAVRPARRHRQPALLAHRVSPRRRAGQFRQQRRFLRGHAVEPAVVAQDAASAGRRGPHRTPRSLLGASGAPLHAHPSPATLTPLCPSPARSSRLLRICSDPSPPDTCWSASSATRTSAPWAAATLAQPTCCALAARAWAPPPFSSTCSRAAPPSGWARWAAAHVLLWAGPRDIEALAALCAVLGHMFPVWLRFRGGKGVATGFGVFLVASPLAALSAIAVFAVILALTRYVSLASVLGSASFPVFAWLLAEGERPPLLLRR